MSDERFGLGGIPAWLEPMVKFCPRCASPLVFGPAEGEDRPRLTCRASGHVFYVNPRLVVSTLPITERGEVMLIKRGIEPGVGLWAQPGGFLEIDETVHQGALRETLEETGLAVELGDIVGLYSRIEAAVVTVVFEARIVSGLPIATPETLETRPFAPEAIPWSEIAFETSIRALRDWVARTRPDLPLPDEKTLERPFHDRGS